LPSPTVAVSAVKLTKDDLSLRVIGAVEATTVPVVPPFLILITKDLSPSSAYGTGVKVTATFPPDTNTAPDKLLDVKLDADIGMVLFYCVIQ
jgi:hypothetical protein